MTGRGPPPWRQRNAPALVDNFTWERHVKHLVDFIASPGNKRPAVAPKVEVGVRVEEAPTPVPSPARPPHPVTRRR